MTQRVFILVAGFTDLERHALNTLFRLSENSASAYVLWAPDAPQGPGLALVDGESAQAEAGLSACEEAAIPLVWVGPAPPHRARRSFHRPLAWPVVIEAMGEVLDGGPIELDFDSDAIDTQPAQLEPPPPRALIASAELEHRLYLRARLALSGLTLADEAENAEQARDWMRTQQYAVALVDFRLPGGGWALIKELTQLGAEPTRIIVTKDRLSLADRLRGRMAGAAGMFDIPPDPQRLQQLLHGA